MEKTKSYYLSRNRNILKSVIIDKKVIIKLSNIYGISATRINQIIHSLCRKNNPEMYKKLIRTEIFEGRDYHSKPLLSSLKAHADKFIKG